MLSTTVGRLGPEVKHLCSGGVKAFVVRFGHVSGAYMLRLHDGGGGWCGGGGSDFVQC